ncbi:MAG TPA: HIT domain-containing protein [Candidatus Paceibacterota bacterium]|nr:HIT domain-containing protein [Candidatus Paceibacterota bacterium]
MEDCVFCKIASGDILTDKAEYEGGDIVSFPDIKPVTPGHTLVVPKKHYRWFYELPDDLSNKLFRASKTIAKKLKEETGADYIHLSIVGKDVPHVHVHLMPRMLGDKLPS